MASIRFFVEQIKITIAHKRLIRKWIQQAIESEKKSLGEINYIFCSDKYLLHINKTFLNHDTLTDIVTFPIEQSFNPLLSNQPANNKTISGEIYISIERVKENAKKFNTTQKQELLRVMIHGVLHLCGYGDKSAAQQKKMRHKEDYYLARFSS